MNRRALLAAAAAGALAVPATLTARQRDDRSAGEGRAATSGLPLGRRQLIWSVPTAAPLVALTFDDGPDPELTPRILAVLDRHGVRATFNVMGHNALRHPGLLRAVVAAGHELGNHTLTHQDLAFQSEAATRRQLEGGQRVIEEVAGARPRFFRPPRGELTGSAVQVAAELGCDVLLWSVTRGPGRVGTPATVVRSIAAAAAPGAVVALHDGIGRGTFRPGGAEARLLRARRSVEVAALPAVIQALASRGLRCTTASALLASAGTPPAETTLPEPS
jgi:peptidoglycan-N-acetylglucosamine deacetylase